MVRDGSFVRRDLSPVAAAVGRLTNPSERQKAPGNKQPSHIGLTSENSAGKLRGGFDANRPPFKPGGNPTSPRKTAPPSNQNPDYHLPVLAEQGTVKLRAESIGPVSAQPEKGPRTHLENAPQANENRPGDPPGTLQREVEKAVLEALRGAEERCDRAVAAAEARGKQALAQAELDRERAVRVATMDLEARLRREFAGEKRAIAETAVSSSLSVLVETRITRTPISPESVLGENGLDQMRG